MPVFLDISSKYFGDEYFDIVWMPPAPGTPPKQIPKNQVFDCLKLGHGFFSNISPYLRDECFDIIWEYHPPRTPQNGLSKN